MIAIALFRRKSLPFTAGHVRFNANASHTYEKDGRFWSIRYGKGYSTGILGKDRFCVRCLYTFSQFTFNCHTFLKFLTEPTLCTHVIFGQAIDVADVLKENPHIDGVCGIGFHGVRGTTSPFIQLYQDGVVSEPYFTVWLTA